MSDPEPTVSTTLRQSYADEIQRLADCTDVTFEQMLDTLLAFALTEHHYGKEIAGLPDESNVIAGGDSDN